MKEPLSLRLSTEAMALLVLLQKREGLSRTGIIEMLIREGARTREIHLTEEPK